MSTVLSRLPAQVAGRAAGALAAQVVLASSSLVLQLVAARSLGAGGFGTYAVLFGLIVMATAVSTGLVGDSLTVLDRHRPEIRAALVSIGALVVGVATVAAFAVGAVVLPTSTAAWFAFATAAFMLADLARRLLMVSLRFWTLVLTDLAGLVSVLAVLVACSLAGPLQLNHFLAALATGQLVAGVCAVSRLPAGDRVRTTRTLGDWRAVLGYGTWRATQQFVRPAMLSGARWFVLLTAGAAAVGSLEAARVVIAPATLLIQGFGSYLFSSYAADRTADNGPLLTRADRSAATMMVGSALTAAVVWLLLPWIEPLVTADRFELDPLTVVGWCCYTASCAAVLPYGSLAAVIGRQRTVLLIRVSDSLLSLGLVALLVVGVGISTSWTPWLLSAGSFLGGLVCRQVVLRRQLRTPTGAGS